MTVTRADVVEAAGRLAGSVRRTPVLALTAGDLDGLPALDLKLEHTQHTGSFKARGALNALLAGGEAPAAGVVAASGGNHGLAVAWAARRVGTTAAVFVPASAPAAKVTGLRRAGADVHLVGARYADALAAAREHAARTGARPVHAYDEPAVVAGQGTVGLELAGQSGATAVLVAVGGGGLAGGVAAALAGGARVVGVEPVGCPTWHAARAAGGPVEVEVGGPAADALGASRLGRTGYDALVHAGASSVLVGPDDVVHARRLLWDRLRLAVEPGGAVALAALTCGAWEPDPGERLAVILCGGNADPGDLG